MVVENSKLVILFYEDLKVVYFFLYVFYTKLQLKLSTLKKIHLSRSTKNSSLPSTLDCSTFSTMVFICGTTRTTSPLPTAALYYFWYIIFSCTHTFSVT